MTQSSDITKQSKSSLNSQPIQTIGILGGGQLGMMLAQSAMSLGYRCIFLEDMPNCPAHLYGKVYSSQQFEDFIQAADVFTLEFENTPVRSVEHLSQLAQQGKHHGMFPPPVALQVAQDRLKEKSLFGELGIETVPFCAVSSQAELQEACSELGLPLVLKTSRGGYDGKGQFVIKEHHEIDEAWQVLGQAVTGEGGLTSTPAPLIAEGFVNFSREVSIIAVRSQTGVIRCYDLVENHHHQGILATTHAPAIGISHLAPIAQDAITKIMQHLDYVGVLALELFVSKNAQGQDVLLANEFAPRVHNSGHWSIEGAITSQFENHIRAVVGLPLGDTDNVRPSVMVNVVGEYPNIGDVLAIDGTHYHSYHKQPREGRKIAHITLMPNDVSERDIRLKQVIDILPNPMGLNE